MRRLSFILMLALVALPAGARAFSLELPAGANRSVREEEPVGRMLVPVAPYSNGLVRSLPAEGKIVREAWSISTDSLTTLQILDPLKQQLIEAGFVVLLECATDECGGFDFRYSIPVISEPDMHVDLGDFRYLSARRSNRAGEAEYVTLVVSRSAAEAFIQVTSTSPAQFEEPVVASSKSAEPAPLAGGEPKLTLAAQLEQSGHAVLEDLAFETGSAELGNADFGSLAELAAFLKADATRKVALVGHTDAQGALDRNLTLSKKRAMSVLDRLVKAYGVSPDQVEAAGVGYLAPRASNATEEGREKNRRVEVVLTSTQ